MRRFLITSLLSLLAYSLAIGQGANTVRLTDLKGGTTGQVLTRTGTGYNWATPAGGSPTGTAGGDLSGTYPNPTITRLVQYVTVSTATYTLASTDITGGKVLLFTVACTVTVPTGAVGNNVVLQQVGTGAITIAAGSGLTISKYPSTQTTSSGQYAIIGIHYPTTATAYVSFQ